MPAALPSSNEMLPSNNIEIMVNDSGLLALINGTAEEIPSYEEAFPLIPQHISPILSTSGYGLTEVKTKSPIIGSESVAENSESDKCTLYYIIERDEKVIILDVQEEGHAATSSSREVRVLLLPFQTPP